MNHPQCPITHSSKVKLVQKIDTQKIVELYRDISPLNSVAAYDTLKHVLMYKSLETGYHFFYPFNLQGDEELYRNLEKNDWYYMNEKWEYDESMKFLNSKQKVLEVGCGDGAFLEKLTRTFSNSPIGLELNKAAIEKARQKGLTVFDDSVENFALLHEQSFDVVCLFQVLEHIADVGNFLKAILQILKPGGKLVIGVPNNDSFIRKDSDNPLNLPPHHMGLWNKSSLESLSRYFNLKLDVILYEPLQVYHVDWYTRVTLKYYIGGIIFNILARMNVIQHFNNYFKNYRIKIKGHSILAIYTKK